MDLCQIRFAQYLAQHAVYWGLCCLGLCRRGLKGQALIPVGGRADLSRTE